MRKIWEQMSCAEYEARRKLRLARLTRKPTNAQKDANYVLNQMHKGKDFDLDKRVLSRMESGNRKAREREAFQLLRKLGMV
jgi:hypothetical protein